MAINPIEYNNTRNIVEALVILARNDAVARALDLVFVRLCDGISLREDWYVAAQKVDLDRTIVKKCTYPAYFVSMLMEYREDTPKWEYIHDQIFNDYGKPSMGGLIDQAIPKILDNTLLRSMDTYERTEEVVFIYESLKRIIDEHIPEQEKVFTPYPDK